MANQGRIIYIIVGNLSKDKIVEVKATNNGWSQIEYNGQEAFVSAKYLTSTGQENHDKEATDNKNIISVSGGHWENGGSIAFWTAAVHTTSNGEYDHYTS